MDEPSGAGDWRLELLESPYMYDMRFRWTEFKAPNPQWDHAHCDGCYAKFVEPGYPTGCGHRLLHAGYQATEGPAWLCEDCFRDYREHFRWSVDGK